MPHYRKALYNELSKSYRITVLHSGKKSVKPDDQYSELISLKTSFFSFNFQKLVLSESKKNYDCIISMFDFHWPYNFFVPFLISKKTKFIFWGQWLNKKRLINLFKIYLSNKYISILYSEKHKSEFLKGGVRHDNLHVANNTIFVAPQQKCFEFKTKNLILFTGTFNKRKQLMELVTAFSKALNKIPSNIKLVLIGKGDELSNIKKLVFNLKLQSRVAFKGEITNNKNLLKYYNQALCNISFGQAGLSVLQSLGHGVPFITKKNAISGGEINNIVDNFNGFLCEDDVEDLKEKIILLSNNKNIAIKMGKNAYNYYNKNCTIKIMSGGFISAIEKTKHKK